MKFFSLIMLVVCLLPSCDPHSLEELVQRDKLAAVMWDVASKYSTIESEGTCVAQLSPESKLVAPYVVNITLKKQTRVMRNFTRRYEHCEVLRMHEVYRNQSQLLRDQETYFSAVTRVLEGADVTCAGCACISRRGLQSYEEELSLFRAREHQVWVGVLVGLFIDPVLRALLIVTGLVLNAAVLLAFLMEKSLRRESNLAVLSLIINDVIILAVHAPVQYLLRYHHPLVHWEVYCATQNLVISAGALSVLVLNVQRYFDVCRVLSPQGPGWRHWPAIRATAYLLVIWGWSSGLSVVLTQPELERLADVLRLSIYVLVYVLLFSMLLAIFSCLTSRRLQQGHGASELQQVTGPTLTIALTVAYYVIHIPFFVFIPFEADLGYYQHTVDRVIPMLFHFLHFSYACVNPVLLYRTSSAYRQYFNKYLFRCWYVPEEDNYVTLSALQSNEQQYD